MLTAASLCFCKLLNTSASERLLFPTPLEVRLRFAKRSASALPIPRKEIDIIAPIVPIVFIVFIVPIVSIITIITIITIPPILSIASIPAIPAIPPFLAIGGH